MAVSTWSSIDEKTGDILGLNADSVFLLTVTSSRVKQAVAKVTQQLAEGKAPEEVDASARTVIPLDLLRRIEISEAWETLKLVYSKPDGSPDQHAFKVDGEFADREAIADEIGRATGRTVNRTNSDVSVFRVLLAPSIAAAVTIFFTFLFYHAAGELEAGHQVEATGRRAGLKRLLTKFAGMLGTTGSLALGGLCLAAAIGIAVKNVVRRPQTHTFDFGSAAANG